MASSKAEIFSRHELADGVVLHHHRSPKWKTDVVRVALMARGREDAAARALGSHLLRHGHAGLRGMERVSAFFRDLYGGGLTSHVSRPAIGLVLALRGAVVARDHLPRRPDTLERLAGFMGRLMREPWLATRGFDREIFRLEKTNLLRAIDAIRDNKAHYAEQRLQEETFRGHAFAVPAFGRREDVAALELEDVARSVERAFAEDPILVHVVSPRSTREVRSLVKRGLAPRPRRALRRSRLALPEPRARVRVVREHDDVAQARVCASFRLLDHDPRRDAYPGLLGDMILGGASTSKLFKEVREKRSLAYSVHSSFDADTGTLVVSAGTDASNVGRVLRLVRAQVDAVARGRVTDDELGSALASIAKSLEGTWDSQDALASFHLGSLIGWRREGTPEAVLRRYRRTGLDQVGEVFGRLRPDTVFRLEKGSAKA